MLTCNEHVHVVDRSSPHLVLAAMVAKVCHSSSGRSETRPKVPAPGARGKPEMMITFLCGTRHVTFTCAHTRDMRRVTFTNGHHALSSAPAHTRAGRGGSR